MSWSNSAHVTQLLGLSSRALEPLTAEPTCLESVLRKESYHDEKPLHHNWRVASVYQNVRKACTAMNTQHSQK